MSALVVIVCCTDRLRTFLPLHQYHHIFQTRNTPLSGLFSVPLHDLNWLALQREAQCVVTGANDELRWCCRAFRVAPNGTDRLFTEFWKRKQARCAMRWGMSGFEEQEQTRPQYQGIRCDSSSTFGLLLNRHFLYLYRCFRQHDYNCVEYTSDGSPMIYMDLGTHQP